MKYTISFIAMAVLGATLALSIPTWAQDTSADQAQQRFQKMQTMMDQAEKTKTPRERQQLMAEHMKLMREQIKSMHSMMGQGGMMGQPQTDTLPNSDKGSQMLQQRMDMMQQMMEQMIEMQQLTLPPAK